MDLNNQCNDTLDISNLDKSKHITQLS